MNIRELHAISRSLMGIYVDLKGNRDRIAILSNYQQACDLFRKIASNHDFIKQFHELMQKHEGEHSLFTIFEKWDDFVDIEIKALMNVGASRPLAETIVDDIFSQYEILNSTSDLRGQIDFQNTLSQLSARTCEVENYLANGPNISTKRARFSLLTDTGATVIGISNLALDFTGGGGAATAVSGQLGAAILARRWIKFWDGTKDPTFDRD